jgi:hypothetical protein
VFGNMLQVREDLLDPRIIHRSIAIDLRFDERVVVRREFELDVRILGNCGHSYPKETKGQKKQGKLKLMGNCLKLKSLAMGNCLETSSNGVRPKLQGVKTTQDRARMEKSKQSKDEQTVLNRIQVKWTRNSKKIQWIDSKKSDSPDLRGRFLVLQRRIDVVNRKRVRIIILRNTSPTSVHGTGTAGTGSGPWPA